MKNDDWFAEWDLAQFWFENVVSSAMEVTLFVEPRKREVTFWYSTMISKSITLEKAFGHVANKYITVCGSFVSAEKSVAWVCIRALSVTRCSSSWCWKRYRANSTPVCRGSSLRLLRLTEELRQGFPSAAGQRMSMAPRVMWKATCCYLCDMLCSYGSWESAIFSKRCETWIKLRKFWLVLTPRQYSSNVYSKVYAIYIHFAMLHGSKLWGPNASIVRGTDFASTRGL